MVGHRRRLLERAAALEQRTTFAVVQNLLFFNGGVTIALAAYALSIDLPRGEIVSLVLVAVLSSIPVALPAMFTLAAAVGARALARQGVLPTSLSSPHVLALAALASSDGGQDPVDAAIRAAAAARAVDDRPTLLSFTPFDPQEKQSQVTVRQPGGATWCVVKGAYAVVARLAIATEADASELAALQGKGYRVLAVAAGPEGAMHLAGLIALSDPPRRRAARGQVPPGQGAAD